MSDIGQEAVAIEVAAVTAAAESGTLKLWELLPKDANEPPFYFLNVIGRVLVIAASEEDARNIAAGCAGAPHGEVWCDTAATDCRELHIDRLHAGIVAAI